MSPRGRRAPPEAAAREQRLDLDLLGLQAEHAGRHVLVDGLQLRAEHKLDAAVVGALDDAVVGLQRRMREIGKHISRLATPWQPTPCAFRRRRRCAAIAPVRLRERRDTRDEIAAAAAFGAGLVPGDLERVAASCAPPRSRRPERRRLAGTVNTSLTPGNRQRAAGVESLHLSAERSTDARHARQHVGQLHVDGEDPPCRWSWAWCRPWHACLPMRRQARVLRLYGTDFGWRHIAVRRRQARRTSPSCRPTFRRSPFSMVISAGVDAPELRPQPRSGARALRRRHYAADPRSWPSRSSRRCLERRTRELA